MSRKTVVTFNLPVELVERMDEHVARGQRSAFAERALESALDDRAGTEGLAQQGMADGRTPVPSPAQTRTSEESKTPVPQDPPEPSGDGGGPTEDAQERPEARASSRQRASGAPRRSADVKAGVKPIARKT